MPRSHTPVNNPSGFAFMTGNYERNSKNINTIFFILDSGASDHFINDSELSENFSMLKSPIKISIAKNGAFITATKRGTLSIKTNMGHLGEIHDVHYCHELPYNLLSVSRLQQAGMTIIFGEGNVVIYKNGEPITEGIKTNNLIGIEFKINDNILNLFNAYNITSKHHSNDYDLWHKRLGHIGKNKFLELKNKEMVDNVDEINKIIPNDELCEACINGKQTRLSFNKEKDKSYVKRPLLNVHSDVCGPITPSTVNNKNYFVLFVDEYTHYCVTYLLMYKSDVFSAFKDYVAKSEARFDNKIINLYIDNGREYLSNEMTAYCVEKGISYHLTVPRTPQLNEVSERMVRTITERARAMISGAKIEKLFWGEAVLTATYLINLTPTKGLKQIKTSYEMWHDRKPKLKYLRVFGSTVYVHDKIKRNKFDDESWKGILVGYEPNGYKVWDEETNNFFVVRDVIIDEINSLKTRPITDSNEINKSNETDWLKSVDFLKSCNSQLSDKETDKIKSVNEMFKSDNDKSGEAQTDNDKSGETQTDNEKSVKKLKGQNSSIVEKELIEVLC